MRLPLPIAIGLLCIAGTSTPAFAAARFWTGAGPNNLWSTPQNWQGNVAPVSGDGVTFPDGVPQTTNVNDLPSGTLLTAIAFHATYVVSGNRVLLDNNIRVAGANGTTVVLQFDITTGGNGATLLFVDVADGQFLVTTGVISGATPVVKVAPGTWNISGAAPNTYTGETRVFAGMIVLNKPAGMAAVPAGLAIGDNIGGATADVVRLASDRQIVGPVTVRNSGLLELNGRFDSVGALVMTSGQITTGAGELTLEADVEVFGEGSSISGRLALGGPPRVFTTHSASQANTALSISAVIGALGGDGGLIKRGPGIMILEGANAYAGFTRVEAGTLWAGHPQALGAAAADAGTGVLAGGRVAISDNVGFEPLLLEKGSATQHALQCLGAGAKTWLGPIHLTGSNGFFSPPTCTLRLGPVSGAGEFWTSGNVVELNAAGSNYVGDTRVESGTLRINGGNRIPDTTTVRLPTNGILSLNGFNDFIGSLVGGSASQVQLGAGTLTVTTPANTDATFAGVINGSGSVLHNGPGRWILTGDHQHLGTTGVVNGTLQIDGSTAAASEVLIGGPGVLTGIGHAAGTIAGVNGHFRPGRDDGTGVMTTGALGLSANHTVDFRIRPGAGGRIDAHGSVNLFLAVLELHKVGSDQIDTPLVLIDNDGVDPIGSTFAGFPEGSFITAGDQQFRISYVGGTGNDVVITPTELTYYLSEGSTGDFFDTEILIANPHNTTIPVTVEFLVEAAVR